MFLQFGEYTVATKSLLTDVDHPSREKMATAIRDALLFFAGDQDLNIDVIEAAYSRFDFSKPYFARYRPTKTLGQKKPGSKLMLFTVNNGERCRISAELIEGAKRSAFILTDCGTHFLDNGEWLGNFRWLSKNKFRYYNAAGRIVCDRDIRTDAIITYDAP